MSDQLRSLYDRWSRLEEAKTEISEDLKELFAEAKSNGYDTKALRAAFRIKGMSGDEYLHWNEHLCVIDSYVSALGDASPIGTAVATHAHPRVARENLGEAGDQRPHLAAAAPPGSAPRQSPATNPDDDDMAIPASLRRYA